jgi:hypothetical protein
MDAQPSSPTPSEYEDIDSWVRDMLLRFPNGPPGTVEEISWEPEFMELGARASKGEKIPLSMLKGLIHIKNRS